MEGGGERREVRVAGVSWHATTIRDLLRGRRRRFVQGILMHEPTNEHDANALKVLVREGGGLMVGYLKRGRVRASDVDGRYARVELGQWGDGGGVYAVVDVVVAPPTTP